MTRTTWWPILLFVAVARPSGAQEHLAIVDPSGTVMARLDGDASHVQIPAEVDRLLRTEGAHLTMSHNHPHGAGLSAPDLDQLSKAGVDAIEASGRNGSRYRASRGPRFSRCADVIASYARLETEIRSRLNRVPVSEDEQRTLWAMVPHLVAEAMQIAGVIRYERRLDFDGLKVSVRYGGLLSAAVIDAVAAFGDVEGGRARTSSSR